ncbi:MAG: hypothetical protein PF904_08735 [Kiritimatiellae bacterium]|jgi:hypothetical protein|nr:hypothetical protein [Kiritimatiellia bacterium]
MKNTNNGYARHSSRITKVVSALTNDEGKYSNQSKPYSKIGPINHSNSHFSTYKRSAHHILPKNCEAHPHSPTPHIFI